MEFRCYYVYKMGYALFYINCRLQAAIFNIPPALTWNSPVMLLDHLENIGISLLSCIQAEIYVIPYPFTLTWESVHTSPTVFLDLKNGVLCW